MGRESPIITSLCYKKDTPDICPGCPFIGLNQLYGQIASQVELAVNTRNSNLQGLGAGGVTVLGSNLNGQSSGTVSNGSHSVGTVSYTHLDVYKRQM